MHVIVKVAGEAKPLQGPIVAKAGHTITAVVVKTGDDGVSVDVKSDPIQSDSTRPPPISVSNTYFLSSVRQGIETVEFVL